MTHPFEVAGLGVAPFRFVGLDVKVGPIDLGNGAFTGAPGQPMGTCDYCGQGIAYCCTIQDANGATFIVGSTCVEKAEKDYGSSDTLAQTVKRAAAKATKDAKANKVALRVARARELLTDASIAQSLNAKPHPSYPGKTLLEYVGWMLDNAGLSGQTRAAIIVEREAN